MGGPGGLRVVTAGSSQDACQADSEHGARYGSDGADPEVREVADHAAKERAGFIEAPETALDHSLPRMM